MIAMTKFEMVRYLKDYANIRCLMMQQPEEQIGIIFDKYMQSSGRFEDDTREYYDRMRRVYMIYNMMKKFSYLEDFLLRDDNFINNNDLDEIIPENTYSTNMGSVSKKKILQLIRDGFNHNDSNDVDRFKISKNGKYVEIEFLRGPVKMKFSIQQIFDIYNNMTTHRQNNLSLSFDIPEDFDINSDNLYEELNKIKFVHYYFTDKLPDSIIQQFNQIGDTKGLTNEELLQRSEMFHNLSSSISAPVKFDLTDNQKKKIISYIDRYKKMYPQWLDDDINAVMFYFLRKVVPVPLLKDQLIDHQLIMCERFMEDVYETYGQTVKETSSSFEGKNPFKPDDSFDQETFEMLNNMTPARKRDFYKDMLDGEMTALIPVVTYIDSVVTHCCNGETIQIDDIDYNAETIRNSFAHGRWYITTDNSIMMYDALPKNIYDYDLRPIGKIDIENFESWADDYVAQNMNRINVVRGNYK